MEEIQLLRHSPGYLWVDLRYFPTDLLDMNDETCTHAEVLHAGVLHMMRQASSSSRSQSNMVGRELLELNPGLHTEVIKRKSCARICRTVSESC